MEQSLLLTAKSHSRLLHHQLENLSKVHACCGHLYRIRTRWKRGNVKGGFSLQTGQLPLEYQPAEMFVIWGMRLPKLNRKSEQNYLQSQPYWQASMEGLSKP
jgi:hypothetical protein